MQNPIGLHIQGQDNRINRTALLEHCRKANYSTVTVLDDFDLAVQIKNILPNCVVVFRSWGFEPKPQEDYIAKLRNFLSGLKQDKRIVIMVNCEQGFSEDRVNMYCDMIPVAADMGWNLCVGNPSSGSVKSGQGSDPNFWLSPACKRLFELLIKHPGNYLGVHEYTSFVPWAVSNGQFGNPKEPPTFIDWLKDQWHIGRNIQGILKALVQFNLPASKIKIIITEGTIDDMNDIDAMFLGVESNGWRKLIDIWREWFPGQDPQNVLADHEIWTWEKVYLPSGIVVGLHVYTYGDASRKNWETYRVDNAPKYLERMEVYRPQAVQEPPKPEITSIQNPLSESDPLWKTGTIAPAGYGVTSANLRYTPSTTDGIKPFGLLSESYPCLYAHDPSWGDWAQVKYADKGVFIHAWINTAASIFTPTPEPAEPENKDLQYAKEYLEFAANAIDHALQHVRKMQESQ